MARGLDGETVAEGIVKLFWAWLVACGVATLDGAGIGIVQEVSSQKRHLVLDLDCQWVCLRDAVHEAERACTGLGWQALTMLERLGGILSIVTPRHCQSLGSYHNWYGSESDAGFREELAGMGEEPTAQEWADLFKPSDYDASFDDARVLSPDARPQLQRAQAHRLAAEHADPWVRSFSSVVLELAALTEGEASRSVRDPDEGIGPTEPMAVVKWCEDDAMDRVIDEHVQDQWNAGEALPHEFIWPIDTAENADEALERFESGFARLRLFVQVAALARQASDRKGKAP